jgi:holin-like protein
VLEAFAALLAFQLLGEAVAHLTRLPVPGPVIGMVLLFVAWPRLTRLQARLGGVADALLANFGLLFVPAGVGVMLHASLIAAWWAPLLLGVVASSALTMLLAAWLFQRLRRAPDA